MKCPPVGEWAWQVPCPPVGEWAWQVVPLPAGEWGWQVLQYNHRVSSEAASSLARDSAQSALPSALSSCGREPLVTWGGPPPPTMVHAHLLRPLEHTPRILPHLRGRHCLDHASLWDPLLLPCHPPQLQTQRVSCTLNLKIEAQVIGGKSPGKWRRKVHRPSSAGSCPSLL